MIGLDGYLAGGDRELGPDLMLVKDKAKPDQSSDGSFLPFFLFSFLLSFPSWPNHGGTNLVGLIHFFSFLGQRQGRGRPDMG